MSDDVYGLADWWDVAVHDGSADLVTGIALTVGTVLPLLGVHIPDNSDRGARCETCGTGWPCDIEDARRPLLRLRSAAIAS